MDKDTQPLVLTVSEAAKLLRISRGSAYEAIKRSELPYIKVGKRILIPRYALEKILAVDGTVNE